MHNLTSQDSSKDISTPLKDRTTYLNLTQGHIQTSESKTQASESKKLSESAVKPLVGRKLCHRDYETEISSESCAKSNTAVTPNKRMRLINQISCEIESPPPLRVAENVA